MEIIFDIITRLSTTLGTKHRQLWDLAKSNPSDDWVGGAHGGMGHASLPGVV